MLNVQVSNHKKSTENWSAATIDGTTDGPSCHRLERRWDPSCPGMSFKFTKLGHPRQTPMTERRPNYGPSTRNPRVFIHVPVRLNVKSFKPLKLPPLHITPLNHFSPHFLPFLPLHHR